MTTWTAAQQASLSSTISQSLLRLRSIESVMTSNHLTLCHPLLLLPSVFPSIRVFSNESTLHIKWSKYWSFSFSISSSNEYSGLISFRIDWFDLLAVQGDYQESSPVPQFQKHQFFGAQLSLWSNSHIHTQLLEKPYLWLYRPLSANWCLFSLICLKIKILPGQTQKNESWLNKIFMVFVILYNLR